MSKTARTATCGKCETEYERYTVLLKKDFVVMGDWHEMKDEYGNVCEECWHEVSVSDEYAVIE